MNKFMKCLKFLMLIETKQSILKTFKWGSKKWMLKYPKMICLKCFKLQEKVNSVLNNSDNLFSINEGFYLIKLIYIYLICLLDKYLLTNEKIVDSMIRRVVKCFYILKSDFFPDRKRRI